MVGQGRSCPGRSWRSPEDIALAAEFHPLDSAQGQALAAKTRQEWGNLSREIAQKTKSISELVLIFLPSP